MKREGGQFIKPSGRNPLHQAAEAATLPHRLRRGRATVFLLCLIAAAAAFMGLAFLARREAFFPIDLRITRCLQSLDGPVATAFMNAVSWPGFSPQSTILVAGVSLLLFAFGLKWEAAASALSAVAEELLNTAVKLLIHRPRPSENLVHLFGAALTGYSFPSGHVMFYTCWFGFLWFLAYTLLRRSWLRAAVMALAGGEVLLVGLSRIYLGEHWASDAAGAYLLGALELTGVIQFYRWGKNRAWRRRGGAGGGC